MKTAHDYAQQAARFALLAGVDAERLDDDVRAAWRAGTALRPRVGISDDVVRNAARNCAGNAARQARRARAGGWMNELAEDAARSSAIEAAQCAGYAAAQNPSTKTGYTTVPPSQRGLQAAGRFHSCCCAGWVDKGSNMPVTNNLSSELTRCPQSAHNDGGARVSSPSTTPPNQRACGGAAATPRPNFTQETSMNTDRDLGEFWKVQQQLAQTLQLDIARTLNAKRLNGEPTVPHELHEMAQALCKCNECYGEAQWKLEPKVEIGDAGGDS